MKRERKQGTHSFSRSLALIPSRMSWLLPGVSEFVCGYANFFLNVFCIHMKLFFKCSVVLFFSPVPSPTTVYTRDRTYAPHSRPRRLPNVSLSARYKAWKGVLTNTELAERKLGWHFHTSPNLSLVRGHHLLLFGWISESIHIQIHIHIYI